MAKEKKKGEEQMVKNRRLGKENAWSQSLEKPEKELGRKKYMSDERTGRQQTISKQRLRYYRKGRKRQRKGHLIPKL